MGEGLPRSGDWLANWLKVVSSRRVIGGLGIIGLDFDWSADDYDD